MNTKQLLITMITIVAYRYGSDPRCMSVLMDIQGRLKTIKGFESFQHADLWLNAYFLRRRTKPFTDCEGRFRSLNGKTSLSQTQKLNVDLTTFLYKKRARF